jgi:metal-responsive CopG/Arc/MetJ family transcriptional regulator
MSDKVFNVSDPDRSVRKLLDEESQKRDLSRSQLVRIAVRKYVRDVPAA